MADACPSASMRRFSASASASTMILAFSALAGASTAARRSASTRSACARRRLGHGAVLRFLHRGLGLAFARLAELKGLGLFHLQGSLGDGDLRLGHGLAGDRLGVGVGERRCASACSSVLLAAPPPWCSASARAMRTPGPFGVLDLGVALKARRLLADLLLLVQLGDAHRLFALGFMHADLARACWRWPPGCSSRARPRPRRWRPFALAGPRRWSPAAPPARPPSCQSPRCSPIRR